MAIAKSRNGRRPAASAPVTIADLNAAAPDRHIPDMLLADPAGDPAPVAPIVEAAASADTAPAFDTPAPATEDSIMDTVTDTKTAFAEATENAKTGFAKGQAMVGEMGEFNKGNLEALVESSKIAAKAMETLGQNAAAFMRGQFEDAQAQARSLASVTSPTEFFKLQGDFARSSFEKMIAQTSANTEAMLKLVSEVAQPISNRVALAADKMKVAA